MTSPEGGLRAAAIQVAGVAAVLGEGRRAEAELEAQLAGEKAPERVAVG